MSELPGRIFYFVSLKTILAALFRTFGLPIRVLPSKPSFLHDPFTSNIRIFSRFLAVSTTDMPVNRRVDAYSYT